MPDDDLVIELLEEEISTLLYLMERHRRWRGHDERDEISRQHRIVADILKDAVASDQLLIDKIKGG